MMGCLALCIEHLIEHRNVLVDSPQDMRVVVGSELYQLLIGVESGFVVAA
jgi:hypothetical protein